MSGSDNPATKLVCIFYSATVSWNCQLHHCNALLTRSSTLSVAVVRTVLIVCYLVLPCVIFCAVGWHHKPWTLMDLLTENISLALFMRRQRRGEHLNYFDGHPLSAVGCKFHMKNIIPYIQNTLPLWSTGTKMFVFWSICLEVGSYTHVQRTVNKLQINHTSSAL